MQDYLECWALPGDTALVIGILHLHLPLPLYTLTFGMASLS